MATQRLTGVKLFHVPTWDWRKMYAGSHSQPASAGNISYVEVYNSSKTGTYLYFWGGNCDASVADRLVFEWYFGTKATQFGGQASILSGGPAGSGIIGGFNPANCIGTEFAHVDTTPTRGSWWPYNWPMSVIAPGYSFSVHTGATNAILDGSFWWQESKVYR